MIDIVVTPDLDAAIERACSRIAPLWPLTRFVAVNPFLGFADRGFAETSATLRRVAGADMLMPRAFYAGHIADGFITEADLAEGLASVPPGAPRPADVPALRAAAETAPASRPRPVAAVATIAEVLDRLAQGDRHTARTAFMIDEISKFCAAWFDEGQAAWKHPWRDLPPYAAWREAMAHDRNPETMGIVRFRETIAALPDTPEASIAHVVDALGIPERAVEDYMFRALFDIRGWAAYARFKVWDDGLYGRANGLMTELLAIRLAWGYALFCERRDAAFREAWAAEMADAANAPEDAVLGGDADLAIDLALHEAFEAAWRRRLLGALGTPAPKLEAPAVQAAFCIDVRSEVFRRALEGVAPQVQTLGFAGFFGFPIHVMPVGGSRGAPQCPVLLKPAVVVCEHVKGADEEEETEIMGLRLLRRRVNKAWKAFKTSAVSSFTYVETIGLAFAPKLIGDMVGYTRPAPDPTRDGLDLSAIGRLGPRIEPKLVGGQQTGFDEGARLAMAEAALRGMSLTDGFARLVALVGHGSTTLNNPHASGLDCGACGGFTGEANARVAAAILNDPAVRQGLAGKGIIVPETTVFVAGLHDTTTDTVRLFDIDAVPQSHAGDLRTLRGWLDAAGKRARAERSALLGTAGGDVDAQVRARSTDWSQVRPEWGLAGCAAFIAAPRARTAGISLNGRSFLHSYDWRQDKGFKVLELIMTAPMVVASWITLQYFGSTVNNRCFGAGDKTLHNVVGALGVLEGAGGDLRPGLPMQSLHDGRGFVHVPLRLNVVIEAPETAIADVVAAHEGVRQLVENGWVHLFALTESGRMRRYLGQGAWEATVGPVAKAA